MPKQVNRGVIGIDEVGRGPLAGPVTVCAVYIADEKTSGMLKTEIFNGAIKDSKKIKKPIRNNIYQLIRKKRMNEIGVQYVISSKSASYVDRHGIQQALSACILSCVQVLAKKGVDIEKVDIRLDAGLTVPKSGVRQASFIKGDEKYLEIALASIIAKVVRDRYMKQLAKVHTEYSWESNAGYGTLQHRRAIVEFGLTKYHRRSFLRRFNLLDKADR